MAIVRPFSAVRPTRDKVHLVASRSYVDYSRKDLRDKLSGNPFSFLHVIHPDMGSRKLHKTQGPKRFELVRAKYLEFCREEIFEREPRPCFYLYRQIKNGHPFTGLICAVSVDDYAEGRIRIHEQTLSKRQQTFTEYLDITGINAEPVLLMASPQADLETIYERYLDQRPEYDFTTTNKVRHQLWVVDQAADIAAIERVYASVPALYIADGHHRSASSVALRERVKSRVQPFPADHPTNYFLAYIMDERSVRIYSYNRLVKDLNGHSPEDLLHELGKLFYVHEAPGPYDPGQKGEFSMYLSKQWYSLTLKHSSDTLDAQVLSDKVLGPLLGIHDLRRDKRIAFLEGPRGMSGLQQAVDKGHFEVAFGLYPVAVAEIREIADEQGTMPPKSTWVEPKLRSGLVIYELT